MLVESPPTASKSETNGRFLFFSFFFFSFFYFSQVSALDVAWTILVVSMTSDFLQDLVCMCKGKPICSKNYVCVEQNLSCTSICGCQGNEECRNQLSHQLSVAENLGNNEDCPSDI
jgi:hypothetical protein